MDLKDLFPAGLTLILLAILVGVGLTVIGVLGNSVKLDVAITADKFNASNASCVALGNSAITTTSAVFTNATDGASVPDCFTWDKTGYHMGTCVLLKTLTACSKYHYAYVNASYNRGAATGASDSMDTSVTALGNVPNWYSIIVVVIVAAIIIGLVINSLGKEK